jgi:hypothetical protein
MLRACRPDRAGPVASLLAAGETGMTEVCRVVADGTTDGQVEGDRRPSALRVHGRQPAQRVALAVAVADFATGRQGRVN